MNDHDAFDDALRARLQADEPDDAGFSLKVMGALPAYVAPRQRRWARRVRQAQWVAISLAACGVAGLVDVNGPVDVPHALAAAALVGLLVFWSIPSRWSRG